MKRSPHRLHLGGLSSTHAPGGDARARPRGTLHPDRHWGADLGADRPRAREELFCGLTSFCAPGCVSTCFWSRFFSVSLLDCDGSSIFFFFRLARSPVPRSCAARGYLGGPENQALDNSTLNNLYGLSARPVTYVARRYLGGPENKALDNLTK